MANLDITAMSAALKEYYHGQKVTDLVFKKNPFFAMVKIRGRNPVPSLGIGVLILNNGLTNGLAEF